MGEISTLEEKKMESLSRLWKAWKALKAGTYDKLMDAVLPVIFEQEAVKTWLGVNKRVVGFVVTIIGFSLEAYSRAYPEKTFMTPVLAVWATLSGLIISAIGIAHAGSKERRGVSDSELKSPNVISATEVSGN